MRGLRRRRDGATPAAPAPGALVSDATVPGAVALETHLGPLLLHESDRVVTHVIRETGTWEPAETEFMRRTLRPGMRVIDVGAHCGYFSVLAGQIVGPSGRVVSFEPHPASYELLLLNLWRHGIGHATAFPWAVGDRAGDVRLYVAEGNTGDHRVVPTEDERDSLPVRCAPLDLLLPALAPVDFLKIDTQGFDWPVLQGATGLLARSPRAVVTIELWPFGMERAGQDPAEVVRMIREHGFTVRELEPTGSGPRALDLPEVLARCAEAGVHGHTNLILSR